MQLNGGMEGMLAFLDELRRRKIAFMISQQSPDALEVSFAIVQHRVEVSFYVTHAEFSVFSGDESVQSDSVRLTQLLKEFWSN